MSTLDRINAADFAELHDCCDMAPPGVNLTAPRHDAGGPAGLEFATDSLAMNVYGNADSHFDALCHVCRSGTFYNKDRKV